VPQARAEGRALMHIGRLAALLGGCVLLWILESRWPAFPFGRERVRHVLPNLVLAMLTIVMNLAFTSSLRPAWLELHIWKPASSLWLVTVLSVAILDFFGWLAHVLLHKLAWAWRIHRVHHSDLVVDVTTGLRQHPGETIWRMAWRVLPVATLRIPIPAVALYEALSAGNALLEHANVALPEGADRLVRWLFVTPSMHKWHHSRDARETDTNYGNILSTWDRLFGTFTDGARLPRVRYGLDGFDGPASQSVGGLLRLPLTR
jgi:sterol desaturase/sphingolipid hydroxylase (fatty acid hydroxylase superfamily)